MESFPQIDELVGMILVFLKGYLMSNVYDKAKNFYFIEPRKLGGHVDAKFGLQRFSSYKNNPGKFLTQTNQTKL